MEMEYIDKSVCYIAKSSDGRPAIVFIDEIENDMASVKPEPGRYDQALFIPMTKLYFDDDELFSYLKSAYESHDCKRLDRLWRKARPLKDAA